MVSRLNEHRTTNRKARTANMGFAIPGAPCFVDTFVPNQRLCFLKTVVLINPAIVNPKNVIGQCKNTADTQMVHLGFADTQPNAEKPNESFLDNAPTNNRTEKSNLDD